MDDTLGKWFMSIASIAVVALASWVFNVSGDIRAEKAAAAERRKADERLMEAKDKALELALAGIMKELEDLSKDSETDASQTRQLSMHWTLHSWARENMEEIEDALQDLDGMGDFKLTKYPKLGNENN